MNREEAIYELKNAAWLGTDHSRARTEEAVDMAIQALSQEPTIQDKQAESEKYQKAFDDGYANGYAQARFDYEQEPCTDAVSKQAVLDIVCGNYEKDGWGESNFYKAIKQLPSVNPQPCDDAISREQAIYVASGYCHPANVAKELAKLPSVTQKSVFEDIKSDLIDEANEHMAECDYDDGVRFGLMLAEQIVCMHLGKAQKSGKWITTRTFMHDGEYYCNRCKCDAPNNEKWDYCPNCGCRMVEPQESEEK